MNVGRSIGTPEVTINTVDGPGDVALPLDVEITC